MSGLSFYPTQRMEIRQNTCDFFKALERTYQLEKKKKIVSAQGEKNLLTLTFRVSQRNRQAR